MPNFASRNQVGTAYCLSDDHVGWNLPSATGSSPVLTKIDGLALLGMDCARESVEANAARTAMRRQPVVAECLTERDAVFGAFMR